MEVRCMGVSVYSSSYYYVSMYATPYDGSCAASRIAESRGVLLIQRDGGGLYALSRIFFILVLVLFFFFPYGSCFPRRNAIVHIQYNE